jgi:2-phospho-L-lactate transferase/gluconeogenesis factor (CofD/UPF0052 family)
MSSVLVLGGGHGTQALSLIPNQKIYFGTWDDGGNTGFLRVLYPGCIPLGDVRSVVVSELIKINKIEIANALSLRSDNINQLLSQYKYLTELMHGECAEGFEDFLEEYYEAKLKYLLKHSHQSIPEDNLGNLVFLYTYKTSGVIGLNQCLSQKLDLQMHIDFIFNEPVYLYGYYYDTEKKRLKILDSETDIDTWRSPIVKFFVRDAEAVKPSLNPQLLVDITFSNVIYLAPGSPENYLPAINEEFVKTTHKNNSKVVLLSQLFVGAKDQYLYKQIDFLAKQLSNFEVWLPSRDSVIQILEETNLLMSYAVQDKYLDVFFVPEYKELLETYLHNWKAKSDQNELYMLLYRVYSKRIKAIPEIQNCILRPCIEVMQASDGWKHSPNSILFSHNQLRDLVVARK